MRILADHHFGLRRFDLDDIIGNVAIPDVAEGCLEQGALGGWYHIRKHDDQTGVDVLSAIKGDEVGSVIGDEHIL